MEQTEPKKLPAVREQLLESLRRLPQSPERDLVITKVMLTAERKSTLRPQWVPH